MARVTIEDCVRHIPNRFLLVQAAVRRARQLIEGSRALVQSRNREGVVALREIAAQKVRADLRPPDMPLPEVPPQETGDEAALIETAVQEVGVAGVVSDASQEVSDVEEGSSGEDGVSEPAAKMQEEAED